MKPGPAPRVSCLTPEERLKTEASFVRQAANLMAAGLPRQALYAEAAQAGLDPMAIAAAATSLFAREAEKRAAEAPDAP